MAARLLLAALMLVIASSPIGPEPRRQWCGVPCIIEITVTGWED